MWSMCSGALYLYIPRYIYVWAFVYRLLILLPYQPVFSSVYSSLSAAMIAMFGANTNCRIFCSVVSDRVKFSVALVTRDPSSM